MRSFGVCEPTQVCPCLRPVVTGVLTCHSRRFLRFSPLPRIEPRSPATTCRDFSARRCQRRQGSFGDRPVRCVSLRLFASGPSLRGSEQKSLNNRIVEAELADGVAPAVGKHRPRFHGLSAYRGSGQRLPSWLGIGRYACRTFEPNGSPKVRACTLALADRGPQRQGERADVSRVVSGHDGSISTGEQMPEAARVCFARAGTSPANWLTSAARGRREGAHHGKAANSSRQPARAMNGAALASRH
jgi:hypothetical protein